MGGGKLAVHNNSEDEISVWLQKSSYIMNTGYDSLMYIAPGAKNEWNRWGEGPGPGYTCGFTVGKFNKEFTIKLPMNIYVNETGIYMHKKSGGDLLHSFEQSGGSSSEDTLYAVKAFWLKTQDVLNGPQDTKKYTKGFQNNNFQSSSNSQSATVSVKVSGKIPFGPKAEASTSGTTSRDSSQGTSISTSKGAVTTVAGPGRIYYLIVQLSNDEELFVTHRTQPSGERPEDLTTDDITEALHALKFS